MLKDFGVLPHEKRAREMSDGDYLYCLLQQWLDAEEELEQLCPACRERAREPRCSACGAPLEEVAADTNGSFDAERYRRLKGEQSGISE